jgi:enhancing lycopene biosynthesis protein 2
MRVDHTHSMNAFTGEPVLNYPVPLSVNPNRPLRGLEYHLAIFGHDDIRMLPIPVGTIVAIQDFPVHQSQVCRVHDDLLQVIARIDEKQRDLSLIC